MNDKHILITGVSGTVGARMLKTILGGKFGSPKSVLGVDADETSLFFLENEYKDDDRVSLKLVNLCFYSEVAKLLRDINVVFHGAAFKHVVLCEKSPFAAVENNLNALSNLISAAQEADIESFVFMSSDKAVNPTNVMGATKLLGERLVSAANAHGSGRFFSTRFGNVLGSRGSVVEIFRNQAMRGEPITLTSREMTRFVMTVDEAVSLVIESGMWAKGGEVVVTKMPIMRIENIADAFVEAYSGGVAKLKKVIIGLKPGEKLFEELMSEEEVGRSIELADFFVIKPAFDSLSSKERSGYSGVVSETLDVPYNSHNGVALSDTEVFNFLLSNDFLGKR